MMQIQNYVLYFAEHSFASHALSFSQLSHKAGFFGSFSPALSQLAHGQPTLSHILGATGNWGPVM
jgi:hypothetical protein